MINEIKSISIIETHQPYGVIFDFDGVVAISEPVHQRAWIDVAREFGRPLPDGFLEGGIGSSDAKLANDLAVAWHGVYRGEDVLALKRLRYQERCPTETELAPGVLELLRALAGRHPVALATSSSIKDIEPAFDRHGLWDFFQATLTIEAVTHAKPHPEIYLKASAALGREPGRCWVFEDSITGATAARAAGTRVIGVTSTLTAGELAPVEEAISDFLELERILGWIAGAPRSAAVAG